jgi:hypothetical protein
MSDDEKRTLLGRRHVLIGGALAIASGVALARQPQTRNERVSAQQFDVWVPKKFGEWSRAGSSGVVLPPPDAL